MADDIDRANDQAQQILDLQLAARKPDTLKPEGACHYCGEDVSGDKLFCDSDCRDDHEKEQRIRGRNGRNG